MWLLIITTLLLVAGVLGLIFAARDKEGSTMGLLVDGFKLYWQHRQRLQAMARTLHTGALQGKTVMVTGSARGLGAGIAAHLIAARARVVLPLRKNTDSVASRKAALAAAATTVMRECSTDPATVVPLTAAQVDLVECELELGSLDSIENCAHSLREAGVVIDVLVNNAGMVPIAAGVTAEGFERAFGINYLGTVHLTQTLQKLSVFAEPASPGVGAGRALVINVSSEEHRMASFAPHAEMIRQHAEAASRGWSAGAAPPGLATVSSSGGFTALGAVPPHSLAVAMERYAYSKLLLTTFSHQLAKRASNSLVVRDICPGPVGSEIAREAPWPISVLTQAAMGLLFPSPKEAALPVIELVATAQAASEGACHYHMSKPRPAGAGADDDLVGGWLWDTTRALLVARKPPGAKKKK